MAGGLKNRLERQPMNIVVISCSLHPQSRSHVLARAAQDDLLNLGIDVQLIDLRDQELAFADGVHASKAPDAQALATAIRDTSAVLLAMPIYNWDVNAAAKNLLEVTSRAWDRKVVGFLCVAGGQSSYMSVMGLANSLMLDFRCIIMPRYIYATGGDFGDDRQPTMFISSETIRSRVTELAETTATLASVIAPVYGE